MSAITATLICLTVLLALIGLALALAQAAREE